MRVALGAGERHGLKTINDPDQPEGPIMAARLQRAGGQAVLEKLQGLRSPHLDMATGRRRTSGSPTASA
jgi:hypothetical protein